VRRIWIQAGKPKERKEVCKEEWEGLRYKSDQARRMRWAGATALEVQGSNLAITARGASKDRGLSAAVFLLGGSPFERRRNHHTNFCGEPKVLVRTGAVGRSCQS
jgi:hypothetical protein